MMTDLPTAVPNVAAIASLFPHTASPSHGIFVARRLSAVAREGGAHVRVLSPVPWFPFKSSVFGRYATFARIPRADVVEGLAVRYPRYAMVPGLGMYSQALAMAACLRPQLRALMANGFAPDVLDAHYLYPDGVATAKLARAFGLPFTLTARGSDVTQLMTVAPIRRAILQACEDAGRVITVSESLRRDLIHYGVAEEQVVTLRNGVDADLFDGTGRKDMRRTLGLTRPTLLYAGWLIERKRVDRIVDALRLVPDADLLIAGEGPLRKTLDDQAKRAGLQGRVRFLGPVAPSAMPRLMAAADVLVLASEREGWPNVVLEAMASGTAVVTVDVGGVREFVTQPAGLVTDVADPPAIADTVLKLIQSPLDRGGVRAAGRAFSWKATARELAHMYRYLAASAR